MQESMRRVSKPQQQLYKPGSGPLRKSEYDEATTAAAATTTVTAPKKNLAASRMSRARQDDGEFPEDNGGGGGGMQRGEGGGDRRKSKKPEQPLYVPAVVAKARETEKKMHVAEPEQRSINGNNNNNSERPAPKNKRYSSKRKGNDGGGGGGPVQEEWRSNSPTHPSYRQGSEPRLQESNSQNTWSRTRDTRSVEPVNAAAHHHGAPPPAPRAYQGPPNAKPPSGRRHSTVGVEQEKRQKPPKQNLDHLPPRLRKQRLLEAAAAALDKSQHKFAAAANVPEEPWDGSASLTFQCGGGSSSSSTAPPPNYYAPLPSNQHVTSNNMIYNTLPAKGMRGRGRLQNEANFNPGLYRSMTPDCGSGGGGAPEVVSRPMSPPPPPQVNRARSNESLHRIDVRSPVHFNRYDDQAAGRGGYRKGADVDGGRREMRNNQNATNQQVNQNNQNDRSYGRDERLRDRDRNNRDREREADRMHRERDRRDQDRNNRVQDRSTRDRDREQDGNRDRTRSYNKERDNRRGPDANINRDPDVDVKSLQSKLNKMDINVNLKNTFESISNEAFDWSEEVEMHVKNLEEGLSDAMTRSSSMTSLTEPTSKQPAAAGAARSKRSRRRRERRGRRSMSGHRDRSVDNHREEYSPPSNRHARNRKNSHNSDHHQPAAFKVPEARTRRDRSFDRRETSFDRHRKTSCSDDHHQQQQQQPNWREEIRVRDAARRTSERDTPCDDSTTRRGGIIHLPKEPVKAPVLTIKERPHPSASISSMPTIQPADATRRSPGQKTLFDPHNPNRPIIVNKPNSRVSSTSFSDGGDSSSTAAPSGVYACTDQAGTYRPAWHNENSENFQNARFPQVLKDIRRADAEMQNFAHPPYILQYWAHIYSCRSYLKDSLIYLLREDMHFAENENVELYFWKLLYYNFIEIMRKAIPKEPENSKRYKEFLLELIDEGVTYYEQVLEMLQSVYGFSLEKYTGVNAFTKGSSRSVQLALISAQKIYICLGDLFRYKETVNETTNYGKCRQLYLKAHDINPKNGRPYNQLAVLAFYSRKKLDAVYYYMRSLMSTVPVPSARECLISLFDENRKKYEHERKRREERLEKARAHMKEKESEQAKTKRGSLRKETWIRPDGGRRIHRTTSTLQDAKQFDSEEEDLAALTSVEVNKRFVTSYLHVHGKLITKIGMETFHETALQMLKEFRALLQHSPLPVPSSRFLQLLALNMFAIKSTELKDPDLQPGLRSELQERALIVSLEMFSLMLEKCVAILGEHLEDVAAKSGVNVLPQDALELLPSVKIWCDWMLYHSSIWNPPPSTQDYKVGPSGDAWTRVATLMNLLERLDHSVMARFQPERGEGGAEVRLPEDNALRGFTPLVCSEPPAEYVPADGVDMEAAQFALRVKRLLFFGTEFLCGVEPPILKLEYRDNAPEYVSVVCTTANRSAPNTPPEFNESELLVESFSDEEDEYHRENIVLENTSNEIQELLTRKVELERRQRDQELHRQAVQKILQQAVVSVHIEVKPKNLVPDTNCFIDYLPMLRAIAASNVYTLMVPLIVLNELEGLAKGANSPERIMNPAHAAKVTEASRAALDYLGGRPAGVKCITTKGTILTSTTFTKEDDASADATSFTNDDRILATCMTLCKQQQQQPPTEAAAAPGEGDNDADVNTSSGPRKIQREVVLLTEDRNLRVKALARDVPVREVPSFLQWAGLG